MEKEQKQKKPSPFDLATAHVLERYAWYADRSVDMMPYSEVYKLVNCVIDELTAAHTSTVANICADYTIMVLQDLAHAHGLVEALEEAGTTIDTLVEHLKAANSTIEFEKRTRLELPRDAHGNRIYPDSILEKWGAVEDFWYCNGQWQVRGHDTNQWLPAEEVVVCTEGHEDHEDAPGESSDHATPEAKRQSKAERPHGCKSRSEAESAAFEAFCLDNISIRDLLNLLFSSDDDASEEA